MSKTLLRHTLKKKIIFDIFVETLFKVSHTTVTNIFYCEEDIFGVIKEQNYYLNNKYASHVQRFQIVIFYLFLWTYVFFVVEVSFYFFLYIVFTPICFVKGGGSCFIDVICLRIGVSITYCVFLFHFSIPYVASFSGLPILIAPSVFSNVCLSCVPYVASFSGLPIFDCPFGIL